MQSFFQTLSRPLLRPLLLATFVLVCARMFSMVAEAPFVLSVGAGSIGLGVLSAVWSLGMLAGALAGGRLVAEGRELHWMLTSRTVMSAGFLTLAAFTAFPVGLVVYVIGGFAGSCYGVALRVLLGRIVPDEMMGTTLAANGAVAQFAVFTSTMAAGLLIDHSGAAAAYLVAGTGVLFASMPLLWLRRNLTKSSAGAPEQSDQD